MLFHFFSFLFELIDVTLFFFLLCINSGDGTLGASVAHKQARLYS